MREVHFPVLFSPALNGAEKGEVTIDRDRGLVRVHLKRREIDYVLPLAEVAAMVVWRVTKMNADPIPAGRPRR